MKREVLFIQGGGAQVHDEWDARLVSSLRAELGPEYEVRYPRMPDEAEPSYPAWAATLEHELAALHDDAILVGHSIGGTILINALAERPPEREPGAIILIAAPFVGEGGWESAEWTPPRALGATLPPRVPIHLFHGLADSIVPASHAESYARAIPHASLHLLPERDHQLGGDLSDVAAVIRSIAGGA